jgi:hypothetical protein
MTAMYRGAHISPCGRWRWSLTRAWRPGCGMMIVMLNPSTADGEQDDPTIRRCIHFVTREGFGGFHVVNLLPWRETDPAVMWRRLVSEPPKVRMEAAQLNAEAWHRAAMMTHGPILCAWGADPSAASYAHQFVEQARAWPDRPLVCLGATKSGAPRHPLYVRGDAPLIPWSPP